MIILTLVAIFAGLALGDGPRDVFRGEPGAVVRAPSEASEASRLSHPQLADAPWLHQPAGSPDFSSVATRPSLAFPPGTSYQEALRQLYIATVGSGQLPQGAELGPPLPDGKVLALPATARGGVIIDLRAPWGYDIESNNVLSPATTYPGSLTPEEVRADVRAKEAAGTVLGRSESVWTPDLPSCQVLHIGDETRTPLSCYE